VDRTDQLKNRVKAAKQRIAHIEGKLQSYPRKLREAERCIDVQRRLRQEEHYRILAAGRRGRREYTPLYHRYLALEQGATEQFHNLETAFTKEKGNLEVARDYYENAVAAYLTAEMQLAEVSGDAKRLQKVYEKAAVWAAKKLLME
jgi:hypothetical protein